jgi:cytochrome b561
MSAPSPRYTTIAIALHWLIAVGVVTLIAIGLTMIHAPIAPATRFKLFQLHKSIGIMLLGLIVLRLLWRVTHRPPPLPGTMPPIERAAASGAHALLYLLLVGLPLSGWALVSVAPLNIPTVLFGLVRWPHIAALTSLRNKAPVAALFDGLHTYGGWLLAVLIALHAAAALRHHFVAGDDVLWRMLPGRRRPSIAPPPAPSSPGITT